MHKVFSLLARGLSAYLKGCKKNSKLTVG